MSWKQIDSYLLRLPQHCIICAVNCFLMKSANKISDGDACCAQWKFPELLALGFDFSHL